MEVALSIANFVKLLFPGEVITYLIGFLLIYCYELGMEIHLASIHRINPCISPNGTRSKSGFSPSPIGDIPNLGIPLEEQELLKALAESSSQSEDELLARALSLSAAETGLSAARVDTPPITPQTLPVTSLFRHVEPTTPQDCDYDNTDDDGWNDEETSVQFSQDYAMTSECPICLEYFRIEEIEAHVATHDLSDPLL